MEVTNQEQLKEIMKSPRSLWRRKWTNKDKRIGFLLLFMHGIVLIAPFQFNWSAFCVAFALYIITGLGITLSYHRNLAHRSFKLSKGLEYLFAYCGVQAFQGDPIDWVSVHRYHHRFVDDERDPHSPIKGFLFSHITWLIDSYSLTKKANPQYVGEVKEQERNILMINFYHGSPDNVGDLEKQRFYQFLRKTYLLHPTALAIILYAMGGVPFLVWGMAVRVVCVLHFSFLVNSVCHIWGKQPWNTGDLSRNNWLVGLLALGEGWHNNHHAFEYSARHGLEWWQFDLTWYIIKSLQALGLATDVKLPSETHKQKFIKFNPTVAS